MNIPSLVSRIRRQAGFTMIELLIVITILGILAVAVLSAINPVEQINRGRDTGSRSDAEQLLSAMDRYYAFNGYYPWQVGAADTSGMDWTQVTTSLLDANDCKVTDKLGALSAGAPADCVASDELKVTFIDRITQSTSNPLYMFNGGAQGNSSYVCFMPKSKAFLTEATTRCSGTTPSDYPTEACGGGTTKYSCIP